jgi:enoyl-[acyl-carrier-protein] reductase (NADH)
MTETEPLMAGKRGLIMGVANDRSIAWGIASAVSAQGAELAFTYQGEALAKRVRPLAESVGSEIVLPCDVTDDASIDAVFTQIEARWGGLDFLVHAIAYSDKEGSTSWCMRSPTPTRKSSRASTWTPRATTSSRAWTSPAIPSPRSRSVRCR